jgi:hypothetical protein
MNTFLAPNVATRLVYFALIMFGFLLPQSVLAQDETEQKKEWIQLAPTGARAKFIMPIKPRYIERSFAPIQGEPPVKVRLHLATTNQGLTTYIFGYHDLHEAPKDNKTIDAVLEGAIRGAVGNVNGQLLNNPKQWTFAKAYRGRKFEYHFVSKDKRFIVMSHVFLIGKRQYQLNSVMEATIFQKVIAEKFLDSFQLIIPEDDSPPRPRPSN